MDETSTTKTKPFYQLGGNLPADAPSYVRRAADVDLVTHLMEGRFCYVLTSRQMGKSSLMVQTARKLRESGTEVAVLDLTRIGQNLTPEQWYDGLLIPLGRDFHLEDDLDDFWNSGDPAIAKMGPMQRWMTAVREVILRSVKKKIVVFVDEIDAVRGLPFSTDEFFAGIRQMYNERTIDPELERITFCLLGVAKPSDLIRNVNTTPFNVGHRIELTDFTMEEAQPLLAGLGRPEDAASRILRRILWWTGGHPYLTQRLCAKIAEDSSVVTQADVDRVCESTFLSTRSREKDDNLLFVRERVLRSDLDRASLLDLYEEIRSGKIVLDDDSNPLIDTLRLAGLVTVSGKQLVVRNRIYAHVFDKHWIRQNMPDAELRRQRRALIRGMAISAAIGVAVLAVVGALVLSNQKKNIKVAIAEQTTRDLTDTVSVTQAQEEFDAGDYGPATVTLEKGQQGEDFDWGWLWSRHDGDSAVTYTGHWDEVRSVAVSPAYKSGLVVTGGADSTVRIFDTNDTTCANALKPSIEAAGVPVDRDPPTSVPCMALRYVLVISRDGAKPYAATDPAWMTPPAAREPSPMAVRFSPDGNWVAIATGFWRSNLDQGQIYLWHFADGKVFPITNAHTGAINALAFSSKNEIGTGGNDSSAEFFSVSADGTVRQQKSYVPATASPGGVTAVAFSPDGHYYAMTYEDGHLVVKNMFSSQSDKLPQISVDVSGLVSAAFYGNQTLVLGSKDGHIWQVDCSAQKLRAYLVVDSGQGLVQSLATYKDPASKSKEDPGLLVTGGTDSTIKIWRVQRDNNRIEAWSARTLRGHQAKLFEVAISPDASFIVSASVDKTVRFWEQQRALDSRNPDHAGESPDYASHPVDLEMPGVVRALAFSPAQSGAPSQLVYIRGVPEPEPEDRKSANAACPHPAWVYFYDMDKPTSPDSDTANENPKKKYADCSLGTAVAYSQAGDYVASGAADGTVYLWDTHRLDDPSYKPTRLATERQGAIQGLAFNNDGLLAVSTDKSVMLWKPRSPGVTSGAYDRVPTPIQSGESIRRGALAFSPDGRWLAVCTSYTSSKSEVGDAISYAVNIFDINDPKEPTRLTGGEALDDTGQNAANNSGSGKQAQSPVESGGKLQGGCSTVAFSSGNAQDHKLWIAIGTNLREIVVWSVPAQLGGSWLRIPSPQAPAANINSVAFSPDSRTLAYATTDSKIFLWNIDGHRQGPIIDAHTGGVWAIAFSPNGACLASASADGTVGIAPTALLHPGTQQLRNLHEFWIPFGSYWRSCTQMDSSQSAASALPRPQN